MALHILEEQDVAAGESELNRASQDLLAFMENPPSIERVELLIAELQAILVRLQAHPDTGQPGTMSVVAADRRRRPAAELNR